MSKQETVKIVEVGPRDGLQNETGIITTADKAKLIYALVSSGITNIEITSFVSPKWIPQLADGLELAQILNLPNFVTTTALVPNLKGYESAKLAHLPEISLFMSATQSHSKKNINKSIEEALILIKELTQIAQADQKFIRCYISCAFFCPYEGYVDFANVIKLIIKLVEMGIDEISIGDTIGYATPKNVKDLLKPLGTMLDTKKIAMHFHDTYGMALSNVYASLEENIRIFDSSIGGMGGCPYAPGASGNLASEDLVYLLHGLGFNTGINIDKLVEAGSLAQTIIKKKLPSKYLQASLAKCLNVQEIK